MKKYLNKILAATLTLCMSLTLLTACGSSSSDGSSSDGAAVSSGEKVTILWTPLKATWPRT